MTDNKKRQPTQRARAIKATEMRIAGSTYPQIAAALNYRDPSGAYRAVSRLLDRREHDTADHLRKVAGERYENIINAYTPAALAGKESAARIVLTAAEHHCRLYGLNIEHPPAEGITEHAFATQLAAIAATLHSVNGGDRMIRSMVERVPSAAPMLPEAIREAVFTNPPADLSYDEDWCNVGPEDGDGRVYEDGSVYVEGLERIHVDEDQLDSDDDETIVTIDAEVIEEKEKEKRGCGCSEGLPPSMAMVPIEAVAAVTPRRLGGYDPLRHWKP